MLPLQPRGRECSLGGRPGLGEKKSRRRLASVIYTPVEHLRAPKLDPSVSERLKSCQLELYLGRVGRGNETLSRLLCSTGELTRAPGSFVHWEEIWKQKLDKYY